MIHASPQWESAYNLGGETAYSLIQIADVIREEMRQRGTDLTVEVEKGDEKSGSVLDADRFDRQFGFAPSLSLEDSVRNIAAFMLDREREGEC